MDDESNQPVINTAPNTDYAGTLFEDIRLTFKAILPAVQQGMGVSLVELLFFSQLFVAKELSQAELQKRLGVDGATITRLVKQLEAEKVITRRPDPSDNRFTLVSLTKQSYKLAEEKVTRRHKMQTALMQGIDSTDVACMKRVLAQMRHNVKSILADGEVSKK